MQTSTLQVQHLSKRFGNIHAVDDLSFEVRPGRVTGFLGPNGAGKTTTLRMLLGLITPSSGTAQVQGKSYTSLPKPMTVVGAHLDSGNFHPGRTGRNHMRVAAAEGGVDASSIDHLLELVGMSDAADRRMGQYSLGMLQRLGLATAMLGDPEILILDEPANGLDPEGIRWLRGFLKSLAEQGRTIFLSSHLLGEIQLMAHDVVIINHGKLVTAGSVRELEAMQDSAVLVDSTDPEALREALSAANMQVSMTAQVEGIEAPRITVLGSPAEAVGQVALVAGLPLTHLSEKTSGLEDLFINLVGVNQ